MGDKIVHISAGNEKFIYPFVRLISADFNASKHLFLLANNDKIQGYELGDNVSCFARTVLDRIRYYISITVEMHRSEKVFLHSLGDIKLVVLLFFLPWLLKKCYWVVWGGDLYIYQQSGCDYKSRVHEFFRRPVIKNIGHLVTYIKGDVQLARKWYEAKGRYHECLMYISNTYKEFEVKDKQDETIYIQMGNSADPENNHLEILKKLIPYKDNDILIYAPLSYGSPVHAQNVIRQGKELFGEKFIPLTEFMHFNEYLNFLGKIDIAIFNHKRQQAMGNTITLLGLGKKVYMRSDVTPWRLFENIGIKVFDVENINLLHLKETVRYRNCTEVKKYFSKEKLKWQLNEIF